MTVNSHQCLKRAPIEVVARYVCFVAVVFFSISTPPASAAQYRATITGTASGNDQDVFGSPSGAGNLNGQPFTLEFTIDDRSGAQTYDRNGKNQLFHSEIASSNGDLPVAATLTIRGHSVLVGGRLTNPPAQSLAERSLTFNGDGTVRVSIVHFRVAESSATDEGQVSINLANSFATPPIVGSGTDSASLGDWKTAFPLYAVLPTDSCSTCAFSYKHLIGSPALIQASGSLTPQSIVYEPLQPGASGAADAPISSWVYAVLALSLVWVGTRANKPRRSAS
jgi:hypothetical protein